MKVRGPSSLKRRLIIRLLAFQISILMIFSIVMATFLLRADTGSTLTDVTFANVAVQAIERGRDGRLHIVPNKAFSEYQAQNPDFWFVAMSDRGETISFGNVPEHYSPIAHDLNHIAFADIRDGEQTSRFTAAVRRVSGPAGNFTLFGQGTLISLTFAILMLSNLMMVPALSLATLIIIIVTPWVVRRAFRRLSSIAGEAERIDIDRRGARLTSEGIPTEILPLVEAMNGALSRLDDGYDQHQRFIIDAAHEVRTPIAILQAKIEASPDTAFRQELQRDVARLATLAEQLLDLQRLDRVASPDSTVDLSEVARDVVADLAPLVIGGGSELEFVDLGGGQVHGDAAAIGRSLSNLIQNAVEHGGRHLIVRASAARIEVEDDGPGIPVAERDRVFEPFHRLHARGTGSGLGLNLVRQVMARHDGTVAALEAPTGGTIMRLDFVAARAAHP